MPQTIEDQTGEQLGGTGSILVRRRREHEEMDRPMDRYLTLNDLDQRERARKQVVPLIFSHAFTEETVLWAAVRASVPDGRERTARVEEEHQQIDDVIADIERLPTSDAERENEVWRTFALKRQDMRAEEDLTLPRLQHMIDTVRLRALGPPPSRSSRRRPSGTGRPDPLTL